jgi:hypothetical protein
MSSTNRTASAPIPRFVRPHYTVPELNDDPHAHYAELRRNSPVCTTLVIGVL